MIAGLCAAAGLTGCGMGSEGLPSTLPAGPPDPFMVPGTVPDGIVNRTYGVSLRPIGGTPPVSCSVVSGKLSDGLSLNPTTCVISGTPTTPTTPTREAEDFSIQFVDSSTPRRSLTQRYQPSIRREFKINQFTVVDAVAARSYTKTFKVTTNLSNNPNNKVGRTAEFGNGPITSCSITGLPPAFTSTCTPDATGVAMDVTLRAVTGALPAGMSMLTISATDTPIFQPPQVTPVVPANTLTNTTQPNPFLLSLTVRNEFSVGPFMLVDGVAGRSYTKTFKVTTNLSNNPNKVGQKGEFGNGPITSCSITGLPPAFTPAMGGSAICAPDATGVAMDVTLSAPSGRLAAGVSPLTISATDTPIFQPPQSPPVVPANITLTNTTQPNPFPLSLTVRNEFSFSTPPPADGVAGRSYSSLLETTLLDAPGPSDVGQNEEGNGPATACQISTSAAGPFAGSINFILGGSTVTLTVVVDSIARGSCRLTVTIPSTVAGGQTTPPFFLRATDNPIPQAPQAMPVVPANGIVSAPFTLGIRGPLTVDAPGSNCPGGTCPDGVKARPYNDPLVRSVTTGGDAPLTWQETSGTFACNGTTCTGNPLPAPCQGFAIEQATGRLSAAQNAIPSTAGARTCRFTMQVSDSGIARATSRHGMETVVPPPGTSLAQPFSISLNDELTILNTFLQNGMRGEPYRQIFASNGGGLRITNSAGLLYTWSVVTGGVPGVDFATATTITGRNDDPTLGFYEGTPITASGNTSQFGVTIQIADNRNSATPSCAALALPTCRLATTVNVLDRVGFVATNAVATTGGDTVVKFSDPPAPSSPSVLATISMNTDASREENPRRVLVTPDGRFAAVEKQGATHDVSIIDTITTSRGCFLPSCADPVSSANSDLARNSIPVSVPTGTMGSGNPSGGAITPQFPGPTGPAFTTWVVNPTNDNRLLANVQPIGGTSPAAYAAGMPTTEDSANGIAISTDGTRAFVSRLAAPSTDLRTIFQVLDITRVPAIVVPSSIGATDLGFQGRAVAADLRGHVAYMGRIAPNGTTIDVAVISTDTRTDTYSFVAAIPGNDSSGAPRSICRPGTLNGGIAVSPDARQLYVVCIDDVTVQVWDISNAIPAVGGATTATLVTSISLSSARCSVPIDVKFNASGTRAFVSCANSDLVAVIDTASNAVVATVPTGSNSTATGCFGAIGQGTSCPFSVDTMVNPPLHITTGGSAPGQPFMLPSATRGSPYSAFIVATGGTVRRSWEESTRLAPDPARSRILDTGNCTGLRLDTTTGRIFGTPTGPVNSTCGPFTIRVTDASTPGQFVERQFQIPIPIQ